MPLTFKHGIKRNARQVPRHKWNRHKELLCSLYQEKTVSEVVRFMKDEHNFVATDAQLGRKLREWGVYKYDSKHASQPRGHAINATDSDGFGSAITAQPLQQSLSTRCLIPAAPAGKLVAPVLGQIRDLPDDGWYASVIRWLDSNEADVPRESLPWAAVRNLTLVNSINLQSGYRILNIHHADFRLTINYNLLVGAFCAELFWMTNLGYFSCKYQASTEIPSALNALVEKLGDIHKSCVFGWGVYTPLLSEMANTVNAPSFASWQILLWLPGRQDHTEQPYRGEVDRMSAESTSRASFKSIRSLSRRIRRTTSSLSAEHREYASVPPSQVMRRSSNVSAECRLFPELSDIRSVASESDAMSWKSVASFSDAE